MPVVHKTFVFMYIILSLMFISQFILFFYGYFYDIFSNDWEMVADLSDSYMFPGHIAVSALRPGTS